MSLPPVQAAPCIWQERDSQEHILRPLESEPRSNMLNTSSELLLGVNRWAQARDSLATELRSQNSQITHDQQFTSFLIWPRLVSGSCREASMNCGASTERETWELYMCPTTVFLRYETSRLYKDKL